MKSPITSAEVKFWRRAMRRKKHAWRWWEAVAYSYEYGNQAIIPLVVVVALN